MPDNKNKAFVRGHEPLRVPEGWNGPSRAFVIQLQRILDDIYQRLGPIELKDCSPELQALILGEDEE